ncbi:hypothetical protein COCNU_08G000080 [Cocos nucifera]|uniref:Uncharacterized protein n=1 Tax=Cocos nucifera TaxID=13894 RepID=A0A8K0IH13_COCNU|nr:hypothetical protein COCNU_08G000080 [Cocos nucifera]
MSVDADDGSQESSEADNEVRDEAGVDDDDCMEESSKAQDKKKADFSKASGRWSQCNEDKVEEEKMHLALFKLNTEQDELVQKLILQTANLKSKFADVWSTFRNHSSRKMRYCLGMPMMLLSTGNALPWYGQSTFPPSMELRVDCNITSGFP